MAPGSSFTFFFLLLSHLLVSSCSSGNAAPSSSTLEVRVFPSDGGVLSSTFSSGISVALLVSKSQAQNLMSSSETSTIALLKARLLHDKSTRSVIVRFGHGNSGPSELQNLLLTLETVNRIIVSSRNKHKVGLSVALPLPYLEKLPEGNAVEMIHEIEKSVSNIIVEATVSKDQKRADWYIRSIVARALLVISRLPTNHLHVVLAIRGPEAPKEVSKLRQMISESFKTERTEPNGRIVEVRYIEEPITIPSRRELLDSDHSKATGHDEVFPITPTPTIVTVPGSAGPVAISPTNPTVTPSVFPPLVPVTFPTPPITTPPVTTPPVTVPGTPVPVTNPVTTPSTPGMPTITPTPVPITNPPATPSASPAIPGQTWCVAKAGAPEAALQAALDYACGIGGADCSQIQMGASCYNPNSLQNHASYAFNSYYQRNPVATSCDFGGTATIVSTNPSTGSCVYPTSQSSMPATTTTPTPTPTIESLPPPITGGVPVPVPVPGTVTPPAVLVPGTPSSGNPTDFGFGGPPPPAMTGLTSTSARLQPYASCCFVILISLVLQYLFCRHRR